MKDQPAESKHDERNVATTNAGDSIKSKIKATHMRIEEGNENEKEQCREKEQIVITQIKKRLEYAEKNHEKRNRR